MSDRAAYREYRVFLLQIAESLSQNDCYNIAFLEQLPEQANTSPLEVLAQLEMRDRLSASKLDYLVKVLKDISRHDLVRKAREFSKTQRKGRTALSSLSRLDDSCIKLTANLQVTLLQCKILLQQVENLKEEAEKVGLKQVEEVVAEAHSLLSEQIQRKFVYASSLISQAESAQQDGQRRERRDGTPSSSESSPSSLELEEPSERVPSTKALQQCMSGWVRLHAPGMHAANDSELKAAAGNLKSQSLPRSRAKARQGSTPKQPLVPPTTRVHRDPANNNTTQSLSTSQPVIPGSEQAVAGTTQLVTGRLNQKPVPPPKPNFKNKPNATSQKVEADIEDDTLYEDISSSSFTGDSGFADSKEFLRVSLHLSEQYQLPSQVMDQAATPHTSGQEQLHPEGCSQYAPLSVNRQTAGYYKSLQRDGIQEVQYAPHVPPAITPSNIKTHYMNLPRKGNK